MIETFYLDRPESANALNLTNAKKISAQIKDATTSGLIITSKNPKIFCSGGDIKSYSKMKSRSESIKVNREIRNILQSFQKSRVVIVAAVEGVSVGGGCELALACDRIIASSNARFAFKQVLLSISPGWGGAQRLLSRVSPSVAFDWLSSGRWIGAAEAFRCGLVDEITQPGGSAQRALEFIQERSNLSADLTLKMKEIVADPRTEVKIFEQLWFSKAHRAAISR